MEVLSDWFRVNKLSLNMSKTVHVHFWHKEETIDVEVNKEIIPRVTTTKFLRVWLDEKLSWENQYEHVMQKIQSNRHMLKWQRTYFPYTVSRLYTLAIFTHICSIA